MARKQGKRHMGVEINFKPVDIFDDYRQQCAFAHAIGNEAPTFNEFAQWLWEDKQELEKRTFALGLT